MKFAVIALVATTFAAGAASASDRVTDVEFLKANRCKGLAASIEGVVDPAALNSFIKAERRQRASYIITRGEDEFERARREAKSADRKERLTTELTTACQAYVGPSTSVAKQ